MIANHAVCCWMIGKRVNAYNLVIFGLNCSNKKKQERMFTLQKLMLIKCIILKRNDSSSVVVFNKSLTVEWPAELT